MKNAQKKHLESQPSVPNAETARIEIGRREDSP